MNSIAKYEDKRLVVLCSPQKTCIHKALQQLKEKDFRWTYLGEDISQAINIEQRLKGKSRRIETGDKLNDIARSLRQPYIDYIGKLSLENNSILWWIGSLSEKNPRGSKAFLCACYIKLCQDILNTEEQETLLFFGENRVLRKAIIQNLARFHKYEIRSIELPGHVIYQGFKNIIRAVIGKGYFFIKTMYRLLVARRYRLKQAEVRKFQEGEGFVLLHNWVDQRSFGVDGKYIDSYFGDLVDRLRDKGKNVLIVPHVLYTFSYRQALRKLEQSLGWFISPESFLTVLDVFRIFMKTVFKMPTRKVYPAFEGIEITEIIMNDLVRDWMEAGLASNLFRYAAVRRWKNAGIPINRFIYTYENQGWEKAYCMAFRKYYPEAKIIGYQHTTVSKMLLNQFFSKDERPILPFPDRVITNGKYTEKLFQDAGYDPQKIVCGGAIRYAGILKSLGTVPRKRDSSPPIILVTPSIDKNESVELIHKVLTALGQTDRYKVILKLHPVAPYSRIVSDIGPLPDNFVISTQPVSTLLEECHMLIYTSSTTSIEAISRGVPVLHVGSDFIIDYDDLADFSPGVRQSARNGADISRITENIMKTEESILSQQRIIWDNIVKEMFGPVDEGVYDLFLGN